MEKRRRRRLVWLLTVFIGIFASIAYVKVEKVEAADPYVYENPAWNGDADTLEEIVQKITYVPQSDGTFGIRVYFDITHLDSQTVYNYADSMGYTYQDHADKLHYGEMSEFDYLDFLDARFESNVINLGIEPGKEWSIRCYFKDDFYEWDEPNFSWITLTAPQLKDEDKPLVTGIPVTSIEMEIDELPSETAELIIPTLFKVNGSSGQLDLITDWYVGWAFNDTNTENYADYEFCYPEGEGFQAGKAYALYIEAGVAGDYIFDKGIHLKLASPDIEFSGTVERISADGKSIAFWFFFPEVEKHVHSYKSAVKKSTLSANGKIYEKCQECGKTRNEKVIYKIKNVKLSASSYTYNGKAKKPIITVTDSKGNKVAAKNYTVTYAAGRTKVGKYKVTVKFKGNYSGTKILYFKINPPKTTVSKLTAGAKSLKVTINKKTTQVTGYQIQYSTSKKFTTATTKTKTVTSYKTTAVTLKNLKAKKNYYIRVRTYKTVSGVKYYSGWSGYKSKMTK